MNTLTITLFVLLITCGLILIGLTIQWFVTDRPYKKDISDLLQNSVWDNFIQIADRFVYKGEGQKQDRYYFGYYDEFGNERYLAIIWKKPDGFGKCSIHHTTYFEGLEKEEILQKFQPLKIDDFKTILAKESHCCLCSYNKEKSDKMAELLMKKIAE